MHTSGANSELWTAKAVTSTFWNQTFLDAERYSITQLSFVNQNSKDSVIVNCQ